MYYLAADTFVKVSSASTATRAIRKYIIMENFRTTGSVLDTKKKKETFILTDKN